MNELKHLSRRTVKTKSGDLDISVLSIIVTKHITKDQAKQLVKNIVDVIKEGEEPSDDYFKV